MRNKFTIFCLITVFAIFTNSTVHACNSDEIALLVSFKAKEGQEKAVEEIILELSDQAKAESGTAFYAPYFSSSTNTYYLLERYNNKDAQKAHVENPGFQTLFPKLMKLITEPPKAVQANAICRG